MGILFALLAVWVIVVIVGQIIEHKYQQQLEELIAEVNELRQQQYQPLQEEKEYLTNYQGKNENETFTWHVKNRK